jgi:glycosyltransferase involved in cell wall biosynthesis
LELKIAYVTIYDPSDVDAASGTGFNKRAALLSSGFQIENIGNLKRKGALIFKVKKVFYSRILSKNYLSYRDPILLKNYAAQVERVLAHTSCDVVVSPGTIPIAYLHTEKPIIFWTDATFGGMMNFYPSFSNLCAETIRDGNKMEQLALSKCRLAIYASEWAANTAIQKYDVDPAKVKVVPNGANLNCDRNSQDIELIIKNRDFDTCKLLFIGVDWFRKGGDVALRVAELLTRRGIKTELNIVGCNPPVSLPAFAKNHGFISRKTEEGRAFLDKLMTESHFLILPSRAENFGSVFSEASSFGLPSFATKVGGIPTAIHDGINGHTFPLDSDPKEYCNLIERLMLSRREYNELALSSFGEFTKRLNWAVAGKQVYELISQICC